MKLNRFARRVDELRHLRDFASELALDVLHRIRGVLDDVVDQPAGDRDGDAVDAEPGDKIAVELAEVDVGGTRVGHVRAGRAAR